MSQASFIVRGITFVSAAYQGIAFLKRLGSGSSDTEKGIAARFQESDLDQKSKKMAGVKNLSDCAFVLRQMVDKGKMFSN